VGAEEFLPEKADLESLRRASAGCRGCQLFAQATQTVFGEGPPTAGLLLVGEQPGDSEDREGAPFVGPAGALLDQALEAAMIPRDDVYVTNAVKHFKWEPKGNRRLHKMPTARERSACRPWLLAEIAAVHPTVVVCLGATAGQSLLGSSFRVTSDRGKVMHSDGLVLVATLHPSAVLRQRGADGRAAAFESLVDDLKLAARTAKAT
jgi:uracil-DNA glycosylase